jgi:hypothetical protein
MAKVKSMRGDDVDVDLIKMKSQIMSSKKTEATIKREDFISDRRRRSSSKRVSELLASEQAVRQKLAEQKETVKADPKLDVKVEDQSYIAPEEDFIEDTSVETTTPAKSGRVIKKQG